MSAPRLSELAWDSEHFGLRIARIRDRELDPERLAAADAWCRERGVDCLYLLAGAGDAETARLAEGGGFRRVDERVTLELPAGAPRPPAAAALRPARPQDAAALEGIAATAHRDSRFYADERFDRARADDLYRAWIRRELDDPDRVVLVAGEEEAVGYATGRVDGGRGEIGLVGVAEEARGRGLGAALVSGIVAALDERGAGAIRVATQGRNETALRLYRGAGFAPRSRELWFHRWYSSPGAGSPPTTRSETT